MLRTQVCRKDKDFVECENANSSYLFKDTQQPKIDI